MELRSLSPVFDRLDEGARVAGVSRRSAVRIVGATPQQWLVVVIAVFVFVSAFVLAFQTYLDEFVYENLLARRYEERFGFRGGRVPVQTSGGEWSAYTLLEVTPGGPLDRAGFRAGDVPSGWNHSQVVGFMQSLASACTYPDREFSIGPLGPDGQIAEKRRLRMPCVR